VKLRRHFALADSAYEPNPLAGGGADEALLLAVVADGAPRGVDAARERRFGYDAPVPYPSDQVVLADHAVAIADQKSEEVEDLRLDRDERAFGTQLAPLEIENVVSEKEQQAVAPGSPSLSTARTLPHFAHDQKSSHPQGQIKPASKAVARAVDILHERSNRHSALRWQRGHHPQVRRIDKRESRAAGAGAFGRLSSVCLGVK
jgi:hypothetical protein